MKNSEKNCYDDLRLGDRVSLDEFNCVSEWVVTGFATWYASLNLVSCSNPRHHNGHHRTKYNYEKSCSLPMTIHARVDINEEL